MLSPPFRKCPLLKLLFASALAIAPVPASMAAAHSAQVSFPNYTYPGRYESIQAVDFKNLPLHTWWEDGKPGITLPLKDGKASEDTGYGFRSCKLIGVHALDRPGSTKMRVLVIASLHTVAAGSSEHHLAQVFEWSGGRLSVVQEISADSHVQIGRNKYAVFNPKKQELMVRTSHYLDLDARCCVSAVDVVTYRWDGHQFTEQSVRAELSEYGKREGKKLPRQ